MVLAALFRETARTIAAMIVMIPEVKAIPMLTFSMSVIWEMPEAADRDYHY
jgi:hypothetical protein